MKFLKAWADPSTGKVFCLSEGPSKEAVLRVHQRAQGRYVLNAVKAGSAIPVKFSLGGDHGLDVFEADYPKSQGIQCNSNADVDGNPVIEATSPVSSS